MREKVRLHDFRVSRYYAIYTYNERSKLSRSRGLFPAVNESKIISFRYEIFYIAWTTFASIFIVGKFTQNNEIATSWYMLSNLSITTETFVKLHQVVATYIINAYIFCQFCLRYIHHAPNILSSIARYLRNWTSVQDLSTTEVNPSRQYRFLHAK